MRKMKRKIMSVILGFAFCSLAYGRALRRQRHPAETGGSAPGVPVLWNLI